MASPSPHSGRFKALSGKLLKSPKQLGQKLKGKSKRSSKEEADTALGKRTGFKLDDIPLDAYSKYAPGQPKVVVAIDFGTTYSGYAYAFVHNPDEIFLMRRSEPGQFGSMSHKTPTILLMNEQRGFHSFGYEAREAYHDLDEVESMRWLYFEKFKMELHSRKVSEKRGWREGVGGVTI